MNQNVVSSDPSPGQQTLPGQFNQDPKFTTQKNWIRLGIIALLIIGAVIYAKTQSPAAPQSDNVKLEVSQPGTREESGTKIKVTDQMTAEDTNPTMEIKTSEGKITAVAKRGEGYTHLARRALAEYLKGTGKQELTPEHKIFIEDYLQKSIADRGGVRVGTEAGFSTDQIQSAIDSSLKLSRGQLQNLHQYAVRVPGL